MPAAPDPFDWCTLRPCLSRERARPRCFLFAAVLTVSGQQSSPINRPWPPEVQKVSPDSPALSPAEALKTFYMPPGYKIELVASEPLIQDPIVMDWDRQGRIWVVEMPGFVPNLQAPEPYMEPIGKVVVLEDTDKDGVMDKRTVFADGLVLARSLKVLDRGVLVGEPPNAWLMRDTNGDLKMDTKEAITDLYGRREARVEQNTNDFYWGMDNWMHTANADTFLRLKNGKFEVRKTLMRGEWGVTQDDAGRIYRNTNESSVHVDFVPTPYFLRNPALVRTRGSYEALARRGQRGQRRLAGAAQSRHQSRLSVRHRSAGRHARSASPRSARRRSTAAIGCRPSSTATCSSPSPPPIWSAAS